MARDRRARRRQARRQDRRARRQDRREARTDRIQARKAPKLARIRAKSESGFWSPEAVAERQATVREGIGAGAALAQTAAELGVAAASGGMSELGGLGGIFGGGGGSDDDGGDGGEDWGMEPAGLPSWALPAGIAAVVVIVLIVVVATSGSSSKRRAA